MMSIMVRLAVVAWIMASAIVAAAAPAGTALLGSPASGPSPDRPIGWRGDGTGRYPGATPPTTWERKRDGVEYVTKGIRWATPLPNVAVSTPIIVGDRVFLTCEVADLVCLDKATGRIQWIRSSSEFEGLADADRTDPAFAEKLAPLAEQLAKVNEDVVEALNAQRSAAPAGGYKPPAVLTKKRDLEKQIQAAQVAIDKKGFERYWGQGVFGFAGQTPTSDGQHVGVFYTTGVTACYDFDGNRQWVHRGRGGGSEHGNFASPLLAGGKLVVWANEMRGYDVDTGKLAWTVPAKAYNTYGSLFRVQAGGEPVAAFQWGFFVRVRDGQPLWDSGIFGDSVSTPIVEDGVIFAHVGYPKNNDEAKGFRAFKVPTSTDGGKLTPAVTFKTEWADDEIPVDKEKNPFDRGYVASPLYVDGLVYQMTQGAGLIVNDATTGEVAYRKVLPLKPRTHYWDWAGAAASPTLAGGYIYLMDNQGTTVVLQPGKQYREVAINHLEESRDGKEQEQFLATPIFDGTRMYYRTPGYLYCMGDQ